MPPTYTATGFPFIFVFNDDKAQPFFPTIVVIEGLQKLALKPLGTLLLKRISEAPLAPMMPGAWKVKIVRPSVDKGEMKVTKVGDQPGLEGGSRAVALREDLAISGAGSWSVCYWNACTYDTPLGKRPAFIGLAHELIHCMHNVEGVKKPGYDEEERFTVGIGPYVAEIISENTIRAEHGVAARSAIDPQPAG
jgi:hypothetical protein